MSHYKDIIHWGFTRFIKFFGNIPSLFIRLFYPVKKGRVVFWSYDFKQYSCNPRYLSEYILENHPDFEVIWAFRKRVNTDGIDKRIKCVKYPTWEYKKAMNTAEFHITNCRTDPYRFYWWKRAKQKYIMLWHGGVALKRIEKDAADKLSYFYNTKAKIDSKACSLMVSGCDFQTHLLKNSFWYDGEVLEKGTPRCDIFFQKELHKEMDQKIRKMYNIPEGNKLVLYAPTFRKNKSLEPYSINWDTAIPEINKLFDGTPVSVLLRLHPNMLYVDTTPLLTNPAVIDVTKYHDMQELLCICDLLITDYSSSMFDVSMLGVPCILYATDVKEYDRGYYFDFKDLPYPLAQSQEEFLEILKNFDLEKYRKDVEDFENNKIGMFEDGNASKHIAQWMVDHRL